MQKNLGLEIVETWKFVGLGLCILGGDTMLVYRS